jgi:hypothetical protein
METVGLRPGEKLHEELFYDAELVESTASAKVLRAIAPPSSVDVREHVRQLLAMASGANEGALRLALLSYVGGIERPVTSPVLEEMDTDDSRPSALAGIDGRARAREDTVRIALA